MIRYRFYTGMMAAALLLSSCSQNEDIAVPQEADGTQRLAITTRAAEDTRTFDSFRLYLTDSETNTKTEEHLLTWNETTSAWLEDGQPCATALLPAIVNAAVCDSPDQITFSSNASNTEFYATCKIPTDQSTADKLAAAGKPMFVCGRRLNAGEELSLDFQHACAKLVFNVNKDEVIANGGKGDLSNIKVTAYPSSKYYIKSNANSGSWTAVANEGNFSCFYDETDKTITVYTGFTSYYSGQRIMTLDVDGISRQVLMKGNLKVIPGNVYTFNLKVGPNFITLQDDISIGSWQEGEQQGGNTTNVALPEVTDAQTGIFIHYADGDADNADNLKLGAAASQMIEHVWKSNSAKPHIVIYSPYNANAAYTGTIALTYGTDYCYASINAGGTQTVSQLLGSGNTLNIGDAYQHIMGMLTLQFRNESENTITPDDVKLNNFYANATLTLKSGTVSITGNRTKEIGVGDYSALYVIPQTIPKYGDMVSATYNGTKYIYTTPDDFTITGGEHVTLTLTIPETSTRSATGDAPRRMEGTITIEKEEK